MYMYVVSFRVLVTPSSSVVMTSHTPYVTLQNTYGSGCNGICRCENGGTCHPVDGTCTCPPGVDGQRCEDGCPAGYYGASCEQPCPQQCSSGHCNRDMGYCECASGFFGVACNLPCPVNTYGPNCGKECACAGKYTTGCDPSVSFTF